MKAKHIYLALAIVGWVVPYYFFISFLMTYGLDVRAFWQQISGTPISAFFVADLLIACVIFIGFMFRESARLSIGRQWIYLVALCTVGLSFALPLFLYAREARLERKSVANG
jgi:hypothetical protein